MPRTCVAAAGVDLVGRLPDVGRWSLLDNMVDEDAPDVVIGAISVTGSRQHGRSIRNKPTPLLSDFGPIGLVSKTIRGTALTMIRIGHDERRATGADVPQAAPPSLNIVVATDAINMRGCSREISVDAPNARKIDIRWMQLCRDAGEMLVCHAFCLGGCTCSRAIRRSPVIHNSSAQLMWRLGVLEAPELGALLMMFVVGCARSLVPAEVRQGTSRACHASVARATCYGFRVLHNSSFRWGESRAVCAAAYMSTLAALPRAVLTFLGEPYQPADWAAAMDAAYEVWRGSPLNEVRTLPLCVASHAHAYSRHTCGVTPWLGLWRSASWQPAVVTASGVRMRVYVRADIQATWLAPGLCVCGSGTHAARVCCR